jgi:hypothetical protein
MATITTTTTQWGQYFLAPDELVSQFHTKLPQFIQLLDQPIVSESSTSTEGVETYSNGGVARFWGYNLDTPTPTLTRVVYSDPGGNAAEVVGNVTLQGDGNQFSGSLSRVSFKLFGMELTGEGTFALENGFGQVNLANATLAESGWTFQYAGNFGFKGWVPSGGLDALTVTSPQGESFTITDAQLPVPLLNGIQGQGMGFFLSESFLAGNDSLTGAGRDDTFRASTGDDVLRGRGGNDYLDGGAGTDTAVVSGLASPYTVQDQGGTKILSGPDGTDTLVGIEKIRFGEGVGQDWAITDVALDQLADGSATKLNQQITDLYVAYFNRAPDSDGLAFWFETIYSGQYSLRTIAERFTFEKEYLDAYPDSLSNRAFVEQIYLNLFDRNPDQAGWDWWTNQLDTGARPRSGFILDVIDGAYAPTSGPEDRTLIDNKHAASLHYSGKLSLQPQEGFDAAITTVLNRVSGDAGTVKAAERVIDYAFSHPETLTQIVGNGSLFESLWTG